MSAGEKMFKILIINFFLIISMPKLFSVQSTAKNTTSKTFEAATKLSYDGKLDEAIKLYQTLPATFTTLSNVASCFYAKNDFVQALLFLKKAEKQANFFERLKIEPSIQIVKAKIGIETGQSTRFIAKIKKSIVSLGVFFVTISSFWLELFTVLLWLVLIVAFKKSWHLFTKCALFISFVLTITGLTFVSKAQNTAKGIILMPNSKIFSGPGNHFLTLGEANPGTEVRLNKKAGQYFKVKIDQTKQGWMHSSDLEQI